jgi:hypothetical protein
MDIGTEELSHLEIVGALIRMHLKPMKNDREAAEADPLVAIAGGWSCTLRLHGQCLDRQLPESDRCMAVDLRSNIDNLGPMALLLGLLILIAGITFYFLPSIVAHHRGHRNFTPILLLNIFVGWTFIGWVVALVWAFTHDVEDRGVASNGRYENGRYERSRNFLS